MWFIIFCICFVLLGLIVRASSPKKKHATQNIKESKPQLLLDQIDERLRIKKRGKFDSKTEPSTNSSGYMTRKQLDYYFSHLEGEMLTDYLLAPSDNSLIEVNELEFATMLKKKTDSDNLVKALHDTASNNNEGIAFEKSGDIMNAIAKYEKNLEIAYPALHSYERLMILYRREKRYEDEIRVIEKALIDLPTKSHKAHIEKWKNRLKKAQQLTLK